MLTSLMPATTGEIIRHLCRDRYRRSFVLPNFTPRGWWECDVFELTDAGYFVEYEVKVSRPDFLADASKSKTIYSGWNPDFRSQRVDRKLIKHEMISDGSGKGPSRFFYVTPEGLLTPEDVPAWAGLIEFKRLDQWRVRDRFVKQAPRLHKQRADAAVWRYAREICYWRMHNLMAGLPASAYREDELPQPLSEIA